MVSAIMLLKPLHPSIHAIVSYNISRTYTSSTYIFRHLRQKMWLHVVVMEALTTMFRQIPHVRLSLTEHWRTL